MTDRTTRILALAALSLFIFASVAVAQSAGGDPTPVIQRGLKIFLGICALFIVGTCGYKGVVATHNGHSVLPAIGAAIAGCALCFGGYFLVNLFGGGTGVGALTL